METLMLLAAGAAVLLACVTVIASSARARRPPLRTQREDDLAQDDETGLVESLAPAPASPIDRGAPVIDLEPVAGAPQPARTGRAERSADAAR